MTPERLIYEDASEFIPIPKGMRHHRIEVAFWPLDEIPADAPPTCKRVPPPYFAGRVKELGDVMSTLSAEDWGLLE